MKQRSGEKIRIASVEELLGASNVQDSVEIEIDRVKAFRDHPFQVRDDEQMQKLVESIKENGVLTPVLVRESGTSYELISGHRRTHAATLAGLKVIPAIIKDMTDDEAVLAMVDSNIQREELLPSEKAFAYKMKLEAMKRQAGRQPNNVSQNGTHSRSDQELADQVGSSRNQIQRYIRLTMLHPELLRMVDQKKLAFTLGVEISYLEAQVQGFVYEYLSSAGSIKSAQIEALRRAVGSDYSPRENVRKILDQSINKPQKQVKVTVPAKVLSKYFDQDTTEDEMLETIVKLLDKWRKGNDSEAG